MIRRSMLFQSMLLLGCSSSAMVGPDEDGRVPGTIEFYGDGVRLEMPVIVQAGETFDVRVKTFGGGCTAKGDTEVQMSSARATIRPYDYEPTTDTVCIEVLVVHTHEAAVRFDRRGPATVTVIGRRRPGDQLVAVSRSILVE